MSIRLSILLTCVIAVLSGSCITVTTRVYDAKSATLENTCKSDDIGTGRCVVCDDPSDCKYFLCCHDYCSRPH